MCLNFTIKKLKKAFNMSFYQIELSPEFYINLMTIATVLVQYGFFSFVSLMTPGTKWYVATTVSVLCSFLFVITVWFYVLILSDIPTDIALDLCVLISLLPIVITYTTLRAIGTYRATTVTMAIGVFSFALLIGWACAIDAKYYPSVEEIEWVVESSSLV